MEGYIKRWKENENESIDVVVSDLLKDDKKKKEDKQKLKKMRSQKIQKKAQLNGAIKAVKHETDENKKKLLKEKAKQRLSEYNTIRKKLGEIVSADEQILNTEEYEEFANDASSMDASNEEDENEDDDLKQSEKQKLSQHYLVTLVSTDDESEQDIEPVENDKKSIPFKPDKVRVYIHQLKRERHQIDILIFELEQELKVHDDMDLDEVTDNMDGLDLSGKDENK